MNMEHAKIESDPSSLFGRIDRLRSASFDVEKRLEELSEMVYNFDQELQTALAERFGDKDLRKTVPEWHKLVGSTPEDHNPDNPVRDFIVNAVESFVSDAEEQWGIA